MTSGQWTMGAVTKVRVRFPRDRVSFSPTTRRRSWNSVPKKFFIMTKAFAEETTTAPGYACMKRKMLPEWSGSICCTIR